MSLRPSISAVLGALLTACAIGTDYGGADAGYVVLGMGSMNESPYDRFMLKFQRAGESRPSRWGQWSYARPMVPAVPWHRPRPDDYRGTSERGVVHVASLPPGKYEIFNFEVSNGRISWHPPQEVSIPFEVRPNEVVYLGNFQANPIRAVQPANVFFGANAATFVVVEDRSNAELDLARTQIPTLPIANIRNAVPDVSGRDYRFWVPISGAQAARARTRAE